MERMTRVNIFIPITRTSVARLDAFLTSIVQKYDGYTISEYRLGRTGNTGVWRDKEKKRVVKDDVALFIMDTKKSERALDADLVKLKGRMQREFKQKTMWITTHLIKRIC